MLMKIPEMIYEGISIRTKQILLEEFSFIFLGAILLLLLAVLGERIFLFQMLRVILGIVYILFIPGYCLTTAIFPRVHELDHVERLGLSIGLSIASISILSLILDRLPWGLHFWPILLGEYVIIGLFAAVTIWRRLRLRIEAAYITESTWRLRPQWIALPALERNAYKIVAVSLLLILSLTTWAFLLPTTDKFMTEFYILGKAGLVADYPYVVRAKDRVTVTVGVVNQEKSVLNYHFEVWVTDSLHPENRVRVERSQVFSLRPGEKFEQPISWHMPWAGDDQKVELLLFYNKDPNPSRQLRMWLDVEK